MILSFTIFKSFGNEKYAGVPKKNGWGLWENPLTKIQFVLGNLSTRSHLAKSALDSQDTENVERYLEAHDLAANPEYILAVIRSGNIQVLKKIRAMKLRNGEDLNLLRTLAIHGRSLEGHSAIAELIKEQGDKACPFIDVLMQDFDPHDPDLMELKEKFYMPYEGSKKNLSQIALEEGAHQVAESLMFQGGFFSDDQDDDGNSLAHTAALSRTNPELYQKIVEIIDVSLKNNDGQSLSDLVKAKRDFYCDEDAYIGQPLSADEKELREKECPYWETIRETMQDRFREQRVKLTCEIYKQKSAHREEEKRLKQTASEKIQRELEEIKKKEEKENAELEALLELNNDDND